MRGALGEGRVVLEIGKYGENNSNDGAPSHIDATVTIIPDARDGNEKCTCNNKQRQEEKRQRREVGEGGHYAVKLPERQLVVYP